MLFLKIDIVRLSKRVLFVDGSVAFSRPEEWLVFHMLVTLTCFRIKCVIEKSKLNPEKSMQFQILEKKSAPTVFKLVLFSSEDLKFEDLH